METGLSHNTFETIFSIIQRQIAGSFKLFLFDSRAKGTFSKFSDIDLAIECDQPISTEVLSCIKFELEFSDLPYSVDIIDLQSIDEHFKSCIKNELNLIFEQK